MTTLEQDLAGRYGKQIGKLKSHQGFFGNRFQGRPEEIRYLCRRASRLDRYAQRPIECRPAGLLPGGSGADPGSINPKQLTKNRHWKTRFRKERKSMSQNNGRAKRSEKGLLTPDNCVVAFIDHQPQMLFGTSNFDRQSIINSTVALAKATRIFDVPVVLTTVETKSLSSRRSSPVRSQLHAHGGRPGPPVAHDRGHARYAHAGSGVVLGWQAGGQG